MEEIDIYMEVDRKHAEEELEKKKRKEQSRKKVSQATVDSKIYRQKLKLGDKPFPSPGPLQTTRLTTESITSQLASFYISTHNNVFNIKISLPEVPTTSEWLDDTAVTEKQLSLQTPAEIQTIKYHNNRLAAVDHFGNVSITDTITDNSYSFRFTEQRGCESSWAGIDFNPVNSSQVATAHMMEKTVGYYDNDALVRKIKMIQYPTAIQWITLSNSQDPLLAVTEYNQLSLWDLRSSNCVKRLQANPVGSLYALSFSKDTVSVAGSLRNIHSFDCKKWALVGTWTNCLKYEATFLTFSSVNPSLCYVGGMDSGLSCGEWKVNSSGNSVNSFLGDSRWIGLEKFDNSEVIAGYTETGHVYLVKYDENQLLNCTANGKNKSAPAQSPKDQDKVKKHKQQ